MIVDEADRDIELSPDPFKEAGISIPEQLPYSEEAGSKQNMISNIKNAIQEKRNSGIGASLENVGKIPIRISLENICNRTENPESVKLINPESTKQLSDTEKDAESKSEADQKSCPVTIEKQQNVV